eukprot:5544734-Pyramimonas_sp.AAC.1
MVTATRSTTFDKIQRGTVKAVHCGATWTRDKAVSLGYQRCPMCVLCGEPDSLFHRIWECSKCSGLRASLVDPW